MDAVCDELDNDIGAAKGCSDDPGIAVVEGTHRIEEMCHGRCALVERGVRDGRSCAGVAERHRDTAADEGVDQLVGAGQLRCDRDHRHGTTAQEKRSSEIEIGLS